MGIVGCFLGIANIINIIVVFKDGIPDISYNEFGALVWLVITVVIAITGFLVSKSGHNKGAIGSGITGMVLNGLIILPVLILFLSAILQSFSNNSGGNNTNRSKSKMTYINKTGKNSYTIHEHDL